MQLPSYLSSVQKHSLYVTSFTHANFNEIQLNYTKFNDNNRKRIEISMSKNLESRKNKAKKGT